MTYDETKKKPSYFKNNKIIIVQLDCFLVQVDKVQKKKKHILINYVFNILLLLLALLLCNIKKNILQLVSVMVCYLRLKTNKNTRRPIRELWHPPFDLYAFCLFFSNAYNVEFSRCLKNVIIMGTELGKYFVDKICICDVVKQHSENSYLSSASMGVRLPLNYRKNVNTRGYIQYSN